MNLVCSSPKFESNDQSSYFNIMPGSYMTTPNSDKPCSPGYFDIKPKPSPAQTPYFDAQKPISPSQTPFYDCESMQTTPFFDQFQKQNGITNNESNPNQQQFHQIQFTTLNFTNGNTSNGNNTVSNFTISITPKFQNLQKRPSFNKPLSLPPNKNKPFLTSGLSFTSATTTLFEEYSPDMTANLIKQNLSFPSNSTQYLFLLLDLRSFSMFTTSHIKMSLNICVPSTLLKRGSFTADKIMETLVSDTDKDTFKNWPKYENIILYDNNTDSLSESSPLYHLCKKFRTPDCKAKIGYLKGGFEAFFNKYEDLCEKSTNVPSSGTFPRKRSLMNRRPGPFTCPTPFIEMPGVNPFFSNIRQNIELSSGITETIPIRVPENVTFDQSQIPAFMREIIGEGGKMKLAEIFQDIERTEQKRLQSLMLLNSNQATIDSPFSISAGMEKGTKNRYNNIWPYDHSRVKISECKEGDCDYVNASFVHADGCDKRYIATQGPLPATFGDFWKVIWEQNSRVIVMLTKEEEAGRVQCHRYWSSSTCTHGPIEITFISETSNGSSDNMIIARKFRISHKNHPEAPSRDITQLHFLGWPDFGIPESPSRILNLIDLANITQSQAVQSSSYAIGPMVVHCSAGCGRTGTFCTIDSTLSLLNNIREQGLDVSQDLIQKVVSKFREQRLSMVQTLRQYVFCYEAVLWKLVGAA